jgi:N-methylhydantoinase A
MKRVGIDIGGTFTDIVVLDEETGAVVHSKTPSVPNAPEQGFMKALDKAGVSLPDVRALVHGTTIVTNLIIQRDGARIALITTMLTFDDFVVGVEIFGSRSLLV